MHDIRRDIDIDKGDAGSYPRERDSPTKGIRISVKERLSSHEQSINILREQIKEMDEAIGSLLSRVSTLEMDLGL